MSSTEFQRQFQTGIELLHSLSMPVFLQENEKNIIFKKKKKTMGKKKIFLEPRNYLYIAIVWKWAHPITTSTPTPLRLFNDWQGLKNWQQRAAWSNVIWLVAKCVIVTSIRARRKRKLSLDVSPMGELMDLQYCLTDFRDPTSCFSNMYFSHLFWKWKLRPGSQAWNESNLFAFQLCAYFSNWL